MKSGRRQQSPFSGADPELSALVLCAVPIVRAGIMHLIRARFGGEVRVAGAEGWAPVAAGERYDIVVFYRAGAMTAARLARIAAAARDSAVVVVGPQAGPRFPGLPAFVHWVALGAPIDEWCRVMRAVIGDVRRRAMASSGVLAPGLAAPLPPGTAAGNLRSRNAAALLTPRQLDVFNMLCGGLSNRSIAEQLGLSIGTVKLHVGAILQALQAKRRVEIVLRRAGMQQLPGGRAAAAIATYPQRAPHVIDALADDRLE